MSQVGRKPSDLTADQRTHLRGYSMRDLALKVGIPSWKLPLVYFRGKAKMAKRMHKTPLFEGFDRLLTSLHAENHQLYILSSNSRRNVVRFLRKHKLKHYFKRVYGNAGWFGKGSALRKIIKKNKLQTIQTFYIGDEVRDITGAHTADVQVIAVSWGFGTEKQLLEHKPTLLVRSVDELGKVLEGLKS